MIKATNTIKKKQCYFCVEKIAEVDYKDAEILRKFISSQGKIAPKKRSHLCSKHQRQVATAVKRARIMALLPFIVR
jgi:small subunit ribosomal protein S18